MLNKLAHFADTLPGAPSQQVPYMFLIGFAFVNLFIQPHSPLYSTIISLIILTIYIIGLFRDIKTQEEVINNTEVFLKFLIAPVMAAVPFGSAYDLYVFFMTGHDNGFFLLDIVIVLTVFIFVPKYIETYAYSKKLYQWSD